MIKSGQHFYLMPFPLIIIIEYLLINWDNAQNLSVNSLQSGVYLKNIHNKNLHQLLNKKDLLSVIDVVMPHYCREAGSKDAYELYGKKNPQKCLKKNPDSYQTGKKE